MDREIPAPVVGKRLDRTDRVDPIDLSQGLPIKASEASIRQVFAQATQLEVKAKVALLCSLMTQLQPDQMQAIVEFAQREIADRQRSDTATLENRITSLLLKKDYTYQSRGLSEPTQYYVYLRRRKPKLDRYIGTLFYIPNGCTLSYVPDPEGRIVFNPPHNVFQLKDSKNPAISQIVRLVCLEPPPPEYTFVKQQNDVPEIYLRLEYFDPGTFQLLAEESYSFPSCMYEGGKLDRYRWEVSPATLPVAPAIAEPSETHQAISADKPLRRVIQLPLSSSTFYLENRSSSTAILERMRLWATWSERAMPQLRWEIVQEESICFLRNVSFKRKILSFSLDQAAITLENSLPVLVKWFQDLSLAVSQTQNQRQYSAAHLKLARSLFVEMSLPQEDPLVMLNKLFGVKFSKTGKP